MWDSRRSVPHSCWPKTSRLGPITAAICKAQVARRLLESSHFVKRWVPETFSSAKTSNVGETMTQWFLNYVSLLSATFLTFFAKSHDYSNILSSNAPCCSPHLDRFYSCSVLYLSHLTNASLHHSLKLYSKLEENTNFLLVCLHQGSHLLKFLMHKSVLKVVLCKVLMSESASQWFSVWHIKSKTLDESFLLVWML